MYDINDKLGKETETKKLTTISISKKNYCILKKMGFTGESFNDVLDRILKNNINLLESDSRGAAPEKTLTSSHIPLFEGSDM
jgi:predicted CopG family antitoxin